PRAFSRTIEQRSRVIQRTKNIHALFLRSVHRGDQRCASRSEQELVKLSYASVVSQNRLADRMDIDNAHTQTQANVIVLIPIKPVQDDFVRRFLSGQNRRKQNAVVVDVGFIAENGDFESRRIFQDLFDASGPGHAVADDSYSFSLAPFSNCGFLLHQLTAVARSKTGSPAALSSV